MEGDRRSSFVVRRATGWYAPPDRRGYDGGAPRPGGRSLNGARAPMSRVDVALLLLVLFVIVFLFWSRNVVVRAPAAPTPVSFVIFAADRPVAGTEVAHRT